MKNLKYIKIFKVIMPVFLLLLANITHAIDYIALEPDAFPGLTTKIAPTSLSTYLAYIFDFGIAVAVVLALIMIIYGGVIKMTTDSWTKKDDANAHIENALWGLGLALVSWLILYTINPCMVDFSGSGGCKTANTFLTNAVPSTTTLDASGNKVLSNSTAESELKAVGIKISSTENCSDPKNPKCTSLEGLPQKAIDGLIQADKLCGSNCIDITGGTETGHLSHGADTATVDIRYNSTVLAALKKEGLSESQFAGKETRGIFTCEPIGGGKTFVPCSSPNAGVIHTQF